MTFEAIRQETGKRLAIWEMTSNEMGQLQLAIRDGNESLTCIDPLCKGALSIRCIDSTNRVPHFYHQRGNINCITHVSESEQHRTGKLELIRYLLGVYPRATFETERSIKVTNGTKPTRRVDVSCTLPTGELIAFELQLSRQSAQTTVSRTDDLIAGGYGDVVWVWGDPQKSSPSCGESNRYCIASRYFYMTMQITAQEEYRFNMIDCKIERAKIERERERMERERMERERMERAKIERVHSPSVVPHTRITYDEFMGELKQTILDNAAAAREYAARKISPTR